MLKLFPIPDSSPEQPSKCVVCDQFIQTTGSAGSSSHFQGCKNSQYHGDGYQPAALEDILMDRKLRSGTLDKCWTQGYNPLGYEVIDRNIEEGTEKIVDLYALGADDDARKKYRRSAGIPERIRWITWQPNQILNAMTRFKSDFQIWLDLVAPMREDPDNKSAGLQYFWKHKEWRHLNSDDLYNHWWMKRLHPAWWTFHMEKAYMCTLRWNRDQNNGAQPSGEGSGKGKTKVNKSVAPPTYWNEQALERDLFIIDRISEGQQRLLRTEVLPRRLPKHGWPTFADQSTAKYMGERSLEWYSKKERFKLLPKLQDLELQRLNGWEQNPRTQ